MRRLSLGLLALAALAASACGGHERAHGATAAGDRRGLVLRMSLTSTGSSLVVETHVRNGRAATVRLVPDQCGRITEISLARTRFQPTGRRWPGSLEAVKRYIVTDQRSAQDPDRFFPRRVGETGSKPPECGRPTRPVELAPGAAVDERWELPFSEASALDAVGSSHSVVRAEIVEARRPARLEFLDIGATGEADATRRGRNLRVQLPVSRVLKRAPTHPDRPPSLAQVYDRLVQDPRLRRWLTAQPVGSWRYAHLWRLDGKLDFKAITDRYERAAHATARPDGSAVEADFPGPGDRARVFVHRPGTLPPGIGAIPERDGYELREDVLLGDVRLPSGRITVGEYLDEPPLPIHVAPAAYPVHATLARYRSGSSDSVAFASLVLSERPTLRWKHVMTIAVDGGTTAITSPEGAKLIGEHTRELMFDSLTAHAYEATSFDLGEKLNLAYFSSGNGDGGYPVYVGFDAAGKATRVVVDFYLLHLDWP